ncbi:MAG: alanine dehydrogenase [Bacteroidales bacterium]|nr:alanine dehydrogenase [Bacteroidales bacterium]MCF8344178.1 alanine dehydrogenase [Bacteroidales bacterium]MCF8350822.1 alanine dehydrogenase [Bacteroidales bacterium]MCF8375389.1 alanine dehydrogenase [Bacteroidales bacterium]MCF8401272.1 alanine dehydrogenase [Bacteroidales bacterium]
MNLSQSNRLMPQEEMLEVRRSRKALTIGLPRETDKLEKRIVLVPNAVGQIVRNGHRVLVETDAGKASHFSDREYSEAGGEIVSSAGEVYKADIILKVAPLSEDEVGLLRKGQAIISSLQLPDRDKSYFTRLAEQKVTALAYELIRDHSGTYPVLQSMSEIVGRAAVYIAAEYLSNTDYGRGNMLGGLPGITPTEVMIIGAGTVGENAARAALYAGAQVKVFDDNIYKLRRLQQNVHQAVFTSILQPKVLQKALTTADVVIGALHFGDGKSKYLIPEDMVRQMKYGSVIVDVSIDQGGCFETSRKTTHQDPVYKIYDVTHYCVPNIASKYPHTASYALSNFFTPVILRIGEEGGLRNLFKAVFGICQGAYLYKGILTNKQIGERYDLPFQNIELLMAAFD